MLYCTGDLHGDRDRLARGPARKLKKRDTLVVCGDFGFVWEGGPQEEETLRWIGERRWTTLFVEGVHDNLDLLEAYPLEPFAGGTARHISGQLWQLLRGEVYTLEGRSLLALGGGVADPGEPWWPQAIPGEEDLARYRRTLADRGGRVDLIVSHQAPTNIQACLGRTGQEPDLLTAYLDEVQRTAAFDAWYFGCYHLNKTIPPKYHGLYDQLRPV